MKGYFAFPDGTAAFSFAHSDNGPFAQEPNANGIDTKPHAQPSQNDEDWERRQRVDEQRHQERLERERREAWLGELAWVRSGGILRDAQGRRDKARTELLKAEIRLQDEERLITERWDAYEARWRSLNASGDPVTWKDIPWPVPKPPAAIAELSPEAIADFIFSTLRVRGNTSTRKDKIRAALLRWHPDKVSVVLGRVSGDEQDVVRQGINAVFISLKQIQDHEKNSS